jgi:HSP20 family protein
MFIVWRSLFPVEGPALTGSAAEVYSKNGNFVYRFAAPGIDPKDVELSVEDGIATLKLERKAPTDVKDSNWHVRRLNYGKFEHSWRLPESLDAENVQASLSNGILEITVPVAKAALPKKIEVKQLAA